MNTGPRTAVLEWMPVPLIAPPPRIHLWPPALPGTSMRRWVSTDDGS
jgi:hypothetical protein